MFQLFTMYTIFFFLLNICSQFRRKYLVLSVYILKSISSFIITAVVYRYANEVSKFFI